MHENTMCIYEGRTSKVLCFKKDLPEDKRLWDDIFLKVMGGPDPKQIDGLGGTVSTNNKIIIVSPSRQIDIDVEYLVAQVVVGEPVVDYSELWQYDLRRRSLRNISGPSSGL